MLDVYVHSQRSLIWRFVTAPTSWWIAKLMAMGHFALPNLQSLIST